MHSNFKAMANWNYHDMEVLILFMGPSTEDYKNNITKTEAWVEVYIIHLQKPQMSTTKYGFCCTLQWPGRSCLVIVDSESEAEAVLTLGDLDGKPFPVSPDTQFNTHTGAVLVPNEICPDGISWSDLFELVAEEHDIAHVSLVLVAVASVGG